MTILYARRSVIIILSLLVVASASPLGEKRPKDEHNRMIEFEDGLIGNLKRETDESYKNTIKYNLIPEVEEVANVQPVKEKSDKPDIEKAKINAIAYNNREVRLVGPDQKEVEMKGDLASTVVVALENLQKEAAVVWGQVSEKLDKGWGQVSGQLDKSWGQVNEGLDKGWTEFKTMVKGAMKNS